MSNTRCLSLHFPFLVSVCAVKTLNITMTHMCWAFVFVCAQISMSVPQYPARMVAHVPTLWGPTRVSVCPALMDRPVKMVGKLGQYFAFSHSHRLQGLNYAFKYCGIIHFTEHLGKI